MTALQTLSVLPFPFWLVVLALLFFGIRAWQIRGAAIGIPMLAVLVTVSAWYVVDVFYNDYSEYLEEAGPDALKYGWWEVLLFLCAFGWLAPLLHRRFNRRWLGRRSVLLHVIRHGGLESDRFQNQLSAICRFLGFIWLAMMVVALVRTDFDIQGLFFPYLGEKADPWSRGRVAGGGLDAVLALAGYCQLALAATFGVLAALAHRRGSATIAITICLLTLPGYIFDRTRSYMLASLLPGFLSLVFLRLRIPFLARVAILLVGFLVLESWLKFVIEARGEGSIATLFHEHVHIIDDTPDAGKHRGLNMFEELGYINSFISDGSYTPNWGARYFAELVNPIPRAIWPGKPMIGIDYAVARGLTFNEAEDNEAGVGGTVSTGMIGEGVVNFGGILGPIAAALLMAFWTALLARQDLLGAETGRLFLYAIGLVLTFNLGRDITLLVLYPFCFGYLLLLVVKRFQRNSPVPAAVSRGRPPTSAPPRLGRVHRPARLNS